MGKSKEFNRDGDPDVENMVKRTGPLGMLPIFIIAASILMIIAVFFWWRS